MRFIMQLSILGNYEKKIICR